ncbi:MAG TPA: hypothetical protein VMH49_00715 [Thermoplasmata archaeon]|nr:hypothetical protein [Thermoplasmata archaeon]
MSTGVTAGGEGLSFVRPSGVRERVLGLVYYLKGRYARAAFRHPRLFLEALRSPDLSRLLQRAEELEFASPAMRAMHEASIAKGSEPFVVDGRALPYSYSDFNHAWGTERTVEVPLGLDRLRDADPARTLEFGNVLGHYGATGHRVIDKYEVGPNVINQDVVDYTPPAPLDLVVSVSTLEHVGWDEVPRDRGKIPRTVERLRSWLSARGEAWVTVPLGYNRWLDDGLRTGALRPDRATFLRRISFDNRWAQCSFEEAAAVRYGGPIDKVVDRPPFPRANGLALLVFRRS